MLVSTPFLLFVFAAARAAEPCNPDVNEDELEAFQDDLSTHYTSLDVLHDLLTDITSIPSVKRLTSRYFAFTVTYRGYDILPENFLIDKDIGLFYLLSNDKYKEANQGIAAMENHCNWLGGEIFQPTFADTQGIPALLESGGFDENMALRLPIYKNDTSVIFYPSGRSATWTTSMLFLKTTEVPTDEKQGVKATMAPLKLDATEATAKAVTATLCKLPSSSSERKLRVWGEMVEAILPEANSTGYTLREAISRLLQTTPPGKICDHLTLSLPTSLRRDLKKASSFMHTIMRQSANTLSEKVIADILTDAQFSLQTTKKFISAVKELANIRSTLLGMTQANHGDWRRLHFDFGEAEEQLLLIVTALLLLSLAALTYLSSKRISDWRARRRRQQLFRRYPNLNDMPLGLRATLL